MTAIEKREAYWAKTRRKGLVAYLIRQGILCNGVVFASLMFLCDYFELPFAVQWQGFGPALFKFLFNALFFGLFMGFSSWKSNEKWFSSVQSKRE